MKYKIIAGYSCVSYIPDYSNENKEPRAFLGSVPILFSLLGARFFMKTHGNSIQKRYLDTKLDIKIYEI